jgi:two-component system phosphate regulon response regulator PhoB
VSQALPRVLVVEDEADIRSLLVLHLKREGLEVDQASTAQEAWVMLSQNAYALAIFDWMLPGGTSGLDLTRQLRAKAGAETVSILMLTARVADFDIVAGLEAGADDYVTKPFEMPVLMARVRALIRRARWLVENPARLAPEGASAPVQGLAGLSAPPLKSAPERVSRLALASWRVGEIELFEEAHRIEVRKQELALTPYEFKLLSALMKNAGKVLTRERLIDLVQGAGVMVVDRAIDTHVFGLRKKLGSSADHIETVRGVGYRMCPPEGPPRMTGASET